MIVETDIVWKKRPADDAMNYTGLPEELNIASARCIVEGRMAMDTSIEASVVELEYRDCTSIRGIILMVQQPVEYQPLILDGPMKKSQKFLRIGSFGEVTYLFDYSL